jgi:NADPH-dependent 7-cyano-7-deazaguanine reductase QueF
MWALLRLHNSEEASAALQSITLEDRHRKSHEKCCSRIFCDIIEQRHANWRRRSMEILGRT